MVRPRSRLAAKLFAKKLANKFSRLTTRVAPIAAAVSGVLILWHAARDVPPPAAGSPAPLVYPAGAASSAAALKPESPPPAALQQATMASTIEVIVGRNDTLDAIFRRMALDPADLAAIRGLPGIRQSLDFLKPGDAIKVTHRDGTVKELSRKVSETETLHVVRDDAGFAAQMTENPVQTRIRIASATIDSSLFQAAESAHMSEMVALRLANVFAWDIDFVLDIRPGDRFTAVYQQIYQDGKYLRDGDVLAAEFVNNGKVLSGGSLRERVGHGRLLHARWQADAQGVFARAGGIHPGKLGVQPPPTAPDPESHPRTYGDRLRGAHRYAGACRRRRARQLRGRARGLRQCHRAVA